VTNGGRVSPSFKDMFMRGLFLLLLVLSCRMGRETKPVTSERERDSVLGESKLPGAAGVRGAVRAADSAAARSARVDSVER
jgi:hypothetical protein